MCGEGEDERPAAREFSNGVCRPLAEGVFFIFACEIFGNLTVRDVYKRQPYIGAFLSCAFGILFTLLAAPNKALLCFIAVSYTHLDVYKRQASCVLANAQKNF